MLCVLHSTLTHTSPAPTPPQHVVISDPRPTNEIEDAFRSRRGTAEARTRQFLFDRAFDGKSDNAQLFEGCAAPLVHSVLDGFNSTIFAYGSTGAGKVKRSCGSSIFFFFCLSVSWYVVGTNELT